MKLVKILAIGLLGLVVVGGVGMWWMSKQLVPDVVLGEPAPEVTLTTYAGEPLALSSLKGKVILLDVWGST